MLAHQGTGVYVELVDCFAELDLSVHGFAPGITNDRGPFPEGDGVSEPAHTVQMRRIQPVKLAHLAAVD